jgi:transcriptional regulator with XRE-family HTH domain
MSNNSLGARLRAARTAAGLTVRQLAERTGITHGYLVKLENNQKENPAADKLMRIAAALNVDESELLAYIGVTPTLPEPRVYFRRALGVDAKEADVLAQLIEAHQANKREEGTNEKTNNS